MRLLIAEDHVHLSNLLKELLRSWGYEPQVVNDGRAALEVLRREGVALPVWAGVAGSVPRAKLVSLGTQIGVGSSLKFLSRKGPLARKLLSGDLYSPQSLVSGLESQPGNLAGMGIELTADANYQRCLASLMGANSPVQHAGAPAGICGTANWRTT